LIIDRLSTAELPVLQRVAYWKDIFAAGDQSLSIKTQPEAFYGALTRLSVGELEITSVKSTPLITHRPASDERAFTLQLVYTGRCHVRHAGADFDAESGDIFVVDASKPYELAFTRPVQGLVLSVPWERFGGHAKELGSLAGRPMSRDGGPAAVLSGFIRSAWDQLVERNGDNGAEWPESASGVIWELLTSVLRREPSTVRSRADELRHSATALVEARLGDPEFSSSALAEGLDVSARYLQRVFAEVGTTPSRFLLERRLDAAAECLRYGARHSSITAVALECGFNDLSYFSRTFHRRFGASPRHYRLGQNSRSSICR
jgi:AraC family transcriptional regulator, positive regulator of tynA and feaB